MATTEAKLSIIMLVLDYDETHFSWSKEELSALGNPSKMSHIIKERLDNKGLVIKNMYAIEHKAEKNINSEPDQSGYDIIWDRKHVHIVIEFNSNKEGETFNNLAEIIGVPKRNIGKPKTGGYAADNMKSYLIHIKYQTKLQYVPADVITLVGQPYIELYEERRESWLVGRDVISKKALEGTLEQKYKKIIKLFDEKKLTYNEIALYPEYHQLIKEKKYRIAINDYWNGICELEAMEKNWLKEEIEKHSITDKNELLSNKKYCTIYMKAPNIFDDCISLQKK